MLSTLCIHQEGCSDTGNSAGSTFCGHVDANELIELVVFFILCRKRCIYLTVKAEVGCRLPLDTVLKACRRRGPSGRPGASVEWHVSMMRRVKVELRRLRSAPFSKCYAVRSWALAVARAMAR